MQYVTFLIIIVISISYRLNLNVYFKAINMRIKIQNGVIIFIHFRCG